MKRLISILLALSMIFILNACSSSTEQIDPTLPSGSIDTDSERAFLGTYTVTLNPDEGTASVVPNRTPAQHLNGTKYVKGSPCSDCLKIQNLQFLPNDMVECDIEVTHPYNDPVFTAFDLRVIAMFPAEDNIAGLPVDKALLNRDGLTSIFKTPGIWGYLHGFKAYNKGEDRRSFEYGDVFSQHFEIKLPANLTYDVVVDCCWEPNDGITYPLTMNCPEAIILDGEVTSGLTESGGSANITVDLFDHQADSSITSVTALSDLFTAPISLTYQSGGTYYATYGTGISNQNLLGPGEHDILVQVTDSEDPGSPHDLSAYVVLEATVAAGVVEITLTEDDDYKTPGNYYDFVTYNGDCSPSVIDYFDSDGPWDFSALSFSGSAQRKIFSPTDPEVASIGSNFPGAQHLVKNDGNFGVGTGLYYQAEKHDYGKNACLPLGIYEEDQFGGAVVFSGTNEGFPYPYNISTAYKRDFSAMSGLIKIKYDAFALGQGLTTVTLDSGTSKSALLMRTTIDATIFGTSIAYAITYEWIDNDGNLLALIAAANVDGEADTWNESTYEIFGGGGMIVLDNMYRQ